ncbi:MAG: cation transporter, partial [Hyphomonadaceae bacterium]
MALLDVSSPGCPSGLAPAREADAARPDPSAFVRTDAHGEQTLDLLVKGARCAGCIRKIESGLAALPGMREARLNLTTGRLATRWTPGQIDAPRIVETIGALGYEAVAFDPDAGLKAADAEGRALLRRLAVAGFASMNIMMLSVPVWAGFGEMGAGTRALMHWSSALIAIPTTLYAGQPFFRSAWAALKKRRANMDTPISIAIALTLAMSLIETTLGGRHAYFDGVVMLIFLLLIGRYLDHRLREAARTAARDLLAMQAVTAARIEADGVVRAVAARDIEIGDRLLIAPGDRAPVDGVIEAGQSELDCALLTGETLPV